MIQLRIRGLSLWLATLNLRSVQLSGSGGIWSCEGSYAFVGVEIFAQASHNRIAPFDAVYTMVPRRISVSLADKCADFSVHIGHNHSYAVARDYLLARCSSICKLTPLSMTVLAYHYAMVDFQIVWCLTHKTGSRNSPCMCDRMPCQVPAARWQSRTLR